MSDLGAFVKPEIKVTIFGQERKVNFDMRTYGALEQNYGITARQLIDGFLNQSPQMLVMALWMSTLVFEEFDAMNPFKIKEQLNIEELYTIKFNEMQDLCSEMIKSIIRSIPEPEEDKKKVKKSTQTKNTSGSKKRSKNPKTKK